MTLDFLATEPHFVDHLAPIWHALPEDVRGEFVVPFTLSEVVRAHRIRRGSKTSDAVLVASWGDHKKARKAGYAHIARIEHGIGQSFGTGHPSYAGGIGCEDVELFLTPNGYSAALWKQAYPAARVEVVGCPKIDRLPNYTPTDPPTIVVSFHWQGQTVPEAGSAFDDFGGALTRLRDEAGYNVALHCHPKVREELRPWALRRRLTFIPEFADVLRTATLYACDGVSTLYEFAATGRPVLVLNAAAYRPHVNHGLRFWDAADVGIQVNPGDSLHDAIGRALADAPQQRRNRAKALDMVYAHRGRAIARASRVLSSWARSIQPAEEAVA